MNLVIFRKYGQLEIIMSNNPVPENYLFMLLPCYKKKLPTSCLCLKVDQKLNPNGLTVDPRFRTSHYQFQMPLGRGDPIVNGVLTNALDIF